MNNSVATAEVQASDKWSEYDADNGEQELAAWSILNAKVKHAVNKKFDLTVGVNNIFDEEVEDIIGSNVGTYVYMGMRANF